ncbi:hypothetical protein CAFE_20520 [Caprobacter fermentans]|uniref:DNA-binding protein n=1 Tax=Caproicibacter fermentans TaxID=2576756 RepID=A0A6N8I065_9FIRM|nr:hypothetical protein [Caproicibacter fermentans]MVB11339.1 hypothetical protein [Caproicibacter fermentans]
MVRLRLLDEVIPEIKKIDPDTALTRNAVRQLGLSGKVPVVMAGRKRMYNLDALLTYLGSPGVEQPEQVNGIRAVPERL